MLTIPVFAVLSAASHAGNFGTHAEGQSVLFALGLLLFGTAVFCNAGKAITSNLVTGLGGNPPKYINWGTGSGSVVNTVTGLYTESSQESRIVGTLTRQTVTVTNDTVQVVGTQTVGASGETITEAGCFDASTAGNIYVYGQFTGLALSPGDSISLTFKNTYA